MALERAAVELGADACLPVVCDVRDPESVDAMALRVYQRFGAVNIVVANAGIGGPTKPMVEITPAEWNECVEINLGGVFLTFKAFLQGMVRQRSGSMIAISSLTGKRPLAGRTAYAASKIAVIGLVRSLALELGVHGIRVNAVCPGFVDGPRLGQSLDRLAKLQGVSSDSVREQVANLSPLGRLMSPSEVAAACVFLASDASSAITGEDLNVSAGVTMF
jgi:NAD(P)-dependent dehydrogenase (short-subunit alcohol dehydrogenase family)